MTKFFVFAFILAFSSVSFANSCETKINSESWGVKLSEKQEKKLLKILKKKGYTVVDELKENTLELKLDISYKRGALRGEIADSKSVVKLSKGDHVIASSEKNHCALMNESYIDMEYGVGDIVIFGATKEGAQRRLIKAVKELPDCDEVLN